MLTPLDIRQREFKRSFRGYDVENVDKFIDRLAQSYDALYLENQALKEKLEINEAAMEGYLKMEKNIKDAVIMAQKNADDLQNNARREAELQLEDARLRAEKIIGDAEEKAARTIHEARERARYRIQEAESRVKQVIEEYRFLNKQVQVFRTRFRSFLDAQISLLDEQGEEVLGLINDWEPGWLETAAGRIENDTGAANSDDEEKTAVVSQAEPGATVSEIGTQAG